METEGTAASASARRPRERFLYSCRLAAALVASVVVALTFFEQESAAAAPGTGCTFTGARWTIDGLTGKQYDVTVLSGVSCAQAVALARPLTSKRARSGGVRLVAPSGWLCESFGLRSANAAVGGCVKADKGVSWAPRGGRPVAAAATPTPATPAKVGATPPPSAATGETAAPGAASAPTGTGSGGSTLGRGTAMLILALALVGLSGLAFALVTHRARAGAVEASLSTTGSRGAISSRQAKSGPSGSHRHKPIQIQVETERAAPRGSRASGRNAAQAAPARVRAEPARALDPPDRVRPERARAVDLPAPRHTEPVRPLDPPDRVRAEPARAPDPPAPVRVEPARASYAEVGSDVTGILAAAERTAEGIIAAARAEAENLRREADDYADKRRGEALENATRITANAATEARRLELESDEARRQVDEENARLDELIRLSETVEEELRRAVSSGKETFTRLGTVVEELTGLSELPAEPPSSDRRERE